MPVMRSLRFMPVLRRTREGGSIFHVGEPTVPPRAPLPRVRGEATVRLPPARMNRAPAATRRGPSCELLFSALR
jgi:hypothetical protein